VFHQPKTKFVASFIGSPSMNFLPADRVAAGKPASAAEVGLRPEAIRLETADGWLNLGRGKVMLVERLGSLAYTHVALGDTRIVTETRTDEAPAIDSEVAVAADPGALYFFDAAGARVHG
jgi:ABC-type sugar transport system ATPase subunit